MTAAADETLFVGIGSPHGDDQIGWCIADILANPPSPGIAVRKASVPADLLDWLDGIALLAVCDASRGGRPAGTVQRLDWPDATAAADSHVLSILARRRASDTHGFGLATVLDLAHRLDRLPAHVIVWGVEGLTFEPNSELSPQMQGAVPAIAAAIRNDLLHA
jgi:hydrogenase maturation protease